LQRDPENRPSAKILLEHSFFNINSQKVSDNNIGLNLEIPRNLNSPSKIRNDTEISNSNEKYERCKINRLQKFSY
jgi:serine/threonine protein kinase